MRLPAGLRFALDVAAGALVPVALSRVDFLVERLPSLGVLRGPAAYALAGAAAGLVLGRLLGVDRLVSRVAPAPWWRLLAAAFLLFAAVGLHYAAWLPPSGDEPHYLVMAQSLWRDHDLDLRNEYEGEEWSEYTPGPVRPHWGSPRADGRPFPAHSPGLPLLLALPYAAGGRSGSVVLMALVAAAAALVCRKLARTLAGDSEAAGWAWLAAVGPPLFFYSFVLYTEAPSALVAGLSLLLLLRSGGIGGSVIAALAASALPWLHLKMVPAAAALALVALARLRGRALAAFAVVSLAAGASFAAYYASVFGVASPLAIYGGMPEEARVYTWRAPAGLLLDRSFGLLPIAPAFLVALAGIPGVLRRRAAWPHLLLALAVLVPALSWRMWWGGQCPPARFLVPLLPFLAAALAVRVAGGRHGLVRWLPGLLGAGYALAALAVVEPGARLLLNTRDRPTRLWAALSGEVPIGDYLPSLTHASPRDTRVAFVWLAAIGILLVLDRLAATRRRVDRAFSSFSAAVALLLLIGVAIDVGAGRRPAPSLPPAREPAAPPSETRRDAVPAHPNAWTPSGGLARAQTPC